MICLFDSGATSFTSSGIGELTRVIECVVREELGSTGVYDLSMQILSDDPLFSRVTVGNIIAVKPNNVDPIQAFVIEQIEKPINNLVSVYATHIAQHRARLIPVKPYTADSLSTALSGILTNSLETNPFSISTSRSVATAYTLKVPKTMRDILGGSEGSILDIYGGEWYFNNFALTLYTRRGRSDGAYIVYGQNMTEFNLEEEFNWSDSPTGYLPFWYQEDSTLRQGDIQYTPNYTEYSYRKTVVLDMTEKFETRPTKAALNAACQTYIADKGYPTTNLTVAFNQFESQTSEYAKTMRLGDSVRIINPNYSVNVKSRIVAYEYNVLTEEYNNVTIGTLNKSINELIKEI